MNKAIKTVLTLTAMLAAGCTDGTLAPPSDLSPGASIGGGGSRAALTGTDTLRFSFVIDPYRSQYYNLGAGNSIVFPAGSLCDPVKSTYGVGEWDKPCPLATAPVTIQTKAWLDARGYAHVDFDRQVRFVPTLNPAGWVVLTLTDYGAATSPWTKIMYCINGATGRCIDEAKSDPTVATIKNAVTGQLTRRVKHFSGYSITAGDGCDPNADPDCQQTEGGFSRVDTAAVRVVKP
jgi:hypothetical protein